MWSWILIAFAIVAAGLFVANNYAKIKVAPKSCSLCPNKSSGLNE